jgi:predicted MPP superfamily phosphohydrolase
MRLLHISDLHASTLNERDQRSIVDAMLLDVQKLSKEMPFDAVIFSGDLAFSGKSDDYELASEILLEPLAQTLSLERSRIVLIPGNHDVDFDAIEEYFDRGLSDALTDREAVNKLLSAPSDLEKATARLMGWRTFCDKYYADVANVQPAGPLAFVHTIETNEGMLGIAALNSAWRSSEGNDKGRLLVGETQASSAIDAVAECDVRVAIVHHPLDWLAAFDGDALRTQLEGAGLLVLTGHEHEADPISTTSARGGIVQDRAGCLYQSHNYPNSYSVVDLAPRDTNVIVCVREWYPERSPRGVFDEATRLAEGGKVALTLGSHVSRGHPPYSEVISALTTLVQDHSVIFDTVAASDQQTIDQLLVPPRLFTVPYQEGRAARESTGLKAPDPLAALAAGKVVVICGDSHEDGVTSTLLWLLASQYKVSDEHFPAYLASGRSLGTRDGDNMLSNRPKTLC